MNILPNGSRDYYLNELSKAEAQKLHREYAGDFQAIEDYGFNYRLWDVVLNEIYSVLKNQLSESEMNNLKHIQRQWIKDRDAEAQQRYDEESSGSLPRMVKIETLARLTKERCNELVNQYMHSFITYQPAIFNNKFK